VLTNSVQSQNYQQHTAASTVHDIASDSAHCNPENSSPGFVRRNRVTSIQQTHKIFHEAFRVSTSEKNKNIYIARNTNKDGINKLIMKTKPQTKINLMSS